jgi:hypothetical protein
VVTPTTRRYPRTLAEAYPALRAGCIERHIGRSLRARLSRWLRRVLGA